MQKRILIVDDDAAIGEVLQLMFEDEGYAVEIQMDGHAAEQMVEPFPDLVFLDIRVSGTNGQAICQHLKGQGATRHIPIILLSAHRETQRIAEEAGANDFLTKPFQMEEVLSLAAKYLGNA
ncbi:MAG TPA: response regulator transcription factor [Ktedonobacteraceae bacterium]|nr:response regulator transcription factor [Ktedonobacteraceae bacterium]